MSLWFLALVSGCGGPETEQDPVQEETGVAAVEDSGLAETPFIDFQSATECVECHPRQVAEWQQSMHAYASLSPVFDAMAAKAHRDTSGKVGTFCTGCHSVTGTLAGEPGSITADERSDLSREGVTCDVCHRAVDHKTPVGNTGLIFTAGDEKTGPFSSTSVEGHSNTQSDFLTSPTFCGSCHDVFNYPSLRIEEAFTEYSQSPAAEEGTRCQDCHMGVEPGVPGERPVGPSAVVDGEAYPDRELANHRFIGPDYSLLDDFPYPGDKATSLAAQEEYAGQVQTLLENAVHISDASLTGSGTDHMLHVELSSLTGGHNVPTGFTSERQLWVHVEVVKDDAVVYASGDLDSWGDLRDGHSWEVMGEQAELDTELVNLQSKNLLRWGTGFPDSNLELLETVFPFDATYIYKQSLEPYEQRTYSWEISDIAPPYRVDVALNYRNLPPYVLRALQLDELVERLRIFTIDAVSMQVE